MKTQGGWQGAGGSFYFRNTRPRHRNTPPPSAPRANKNKNLFYFRQVGLTGLLSKCRSKPFSFRVVYKLPVYVVCVCFLPIYSGRKARWMYQPGPHRRKVTQDFSSTFLLRCMPLFFSREGFSRSFPSSTASRILCTNGLIVFHLLDITHVPTYQKVTRLPTELPGRPAAL